MNIIIYNVYINAATVLNKNNQFLFSVFLLYTKYNESKENAIMDSIIYKALALYFITYYSEWVLRKSFSNQPKNTKATDIQRNKSF